MLNPLTWIGGAAVVFAIGVLAGMHWSEAQHQRELAAAKAAFEQLVSDANSAYAAQKIKDDAELLRLKALADTTPANSTIALKKDAAGRVGAIK
jgi:type VI protein secretion system component VasK